MSFLVANCGGRGGVGCQGHAAVRSTQKPNLDNRHHHAQARLVRGRACREGAQQGVMRGVIPWES